VHWKILIVEDNPDSREVLAALLGFEGFNVVTADNGYRGIYQAMLEHPDLIITDLNLPFLDGIEMINRLRGVSELSSVPIIAVTAYTDAMIQWALRAGANEALCKPIDFEPLVDVVKNLLHAA
jgi:DNA-binding response OmpR family regulator